MESFFMLGVGVAVALLGLAVGLMIFIAVLLPALSIPFAIFAILDALCEALKPVSDADLLPVLAGKKIATQERIKKHRKRLKEKMREGPKRNLHECLNGLHLLTPTAGIEQDLSRAGSQSAASRLCLKS
jgi:hypothetical protein